MAREFSLLLPVYAGDDPQALRLAFTSSVTEQTLPPSEVVIVQDGPVSGAVDEVVRELEAAAAATSAGQTVPVRVVRLADNQGLWRALNAGLAECNYDAVARMDADDVSAPERFARQWQVFERGYALVGTGMREFESDPRDPRDLGTVRTPPVGEYRIREHAKSHNPFNHPTMLYSRAAVQRVGGYQEFGSMEDYWLGLRLLLAGERCENIPEPLVYYRVGAGAFKRRGGLAQARTEWRLQREMLRSGFIGLGTYLRNVVLKGGYRLLPSALKQFVYGRIFRGTLRADRNKQ